MKRTFFFLLFFQVLMVFAQPNEGLDELTDIQEVSDKFAMDIRYATSNNFLDKPIYDCARCLLRPEVAKALIAANNYFCEMGYQIKLHDCYRPLSAQKKMWEIYPNAQYVANPYAEKSVHNRGAAVDLTLVDEKGNELNMGTSYDYFGKEAHQDNQNLPVEVLNNRKILREGMEKFGFEIIRTEWWHYNYKNAYEYEVMDIPFKCE